MAELAAQMITMTSSEAQALETQIETQTLTVKQAAQYFQGWYYSGNIPSSYATASQIRRLSRKGRTAVKGLNPFGDERGCRDPWKSKPIEVPEGSVCEFCGKPLEHIAILRRTNGPYDWEVERWSSVPVRCKCERAAAKWAAQDAEDERLAQEEKRRQDEAARKARWEQQLARSGMKARFLTRTFANFITDTPGRTRAHKVAKEYADNFTAHSANGDGLYIEGTFGTGKTHLAAAKDQWTKSHL